MPEMTGLLSISCPACGAPHILGARERNLTCHCAHLIRRSDYQQPAVADRGANPGK